SGFARFNASEADQPESPTENGITVHSTEPQISETESREKGGSDSSETGLWWLREPLHTITPLADRIEVQLVNYLIQHPGITLAELDQMLCTAFPGLLAPDIQLLQAILESYAEPLVPGSSSWQIRPQDQPAARRSDLSEARKLINRLGERLGYQPQQSPPATTSSNATLALPPAIIWAGSTGEPSYWLFPLASAVIGDILLRSTQPPARSIIVLPGGRANLVLHKLRRDPRLNRLCTLTNTPSRTGGWRFLKFRHLRWLFENPLLSPESLDEQIYLDPLTYSTPQLRLL
ncbi:MAG: hypothetical protein JW726_10845, partial [Anaerolineales bacterium]|nr:hypothetical protein [Anaerolineales bacterium]